MLAGRGGRVNVHGVPAPSRPPPSPPRAPTRPSLQHNILRRLASYGLKLTVVPADYPAEKVLELKPDGIFLSNGPGDPSAVPYAVASAKALLGVKPMFGICMGHQVLGQALGGTTFKLKFGHHGGNHPIRYNPSGRIEISAQNHNFAVDPATLPPGVDVTHINLNDGTRGGGGGVVREGGEARGWGGGGGVGTAWEVPRFRCRDGAHRAPAASFPPHPTMRPLHPTHPPRPARHVRWPAGAGVQGNVHSIPPRSLARPARR